MLWVLLTLACKAPIDVDGPADDTDDTEDTDVVDTDTDVDTDVDTDTDTDTDVDTDVPDPCVWTATSTLSGATLAADGVVSCTWSLSEADAGVEVGWTLQLDEAIEVRVDRVGCEPVDAATNLRFLEQLTDGADQRWCPRCDTGPCPADPDTYTTVPGTTRSTFTWRPRQWDGPSDFGATPGDPFTPGTYTLRISAAGTVVSDDAPWSLSLETTVTLTP